MSSQSVYSDEFKRDAVALVLGGMTQRQVVEDLGVSRSTLSKWVNAVDPLRGHTPISERKSGYPDQELVQLKKRNRELEEENYILRRASAYLARQQKSPK